MNISETIIDVIRLPRKFGNLGNVSIHSLLKATGYFENHSQVSESAIREELIRHPEFIQDWMLLSEDKRSNAGWYFRQDDKAGYVVGYFTQKGDHLRQSEYSDPIDACAAFIKREIEDIRTQNKA